MAEQNKNSNSDKLKEITDRLETGIKEVFESEKYKEYLRVMSKFHNYSFSNTMLIALQRPDATLVAGYGAWEKKFGRHVNKGATAIRILVPATFKKKQEMEKIDPKTQKPILDVYGKPVTEEVEVTIPFFKPGYVFDVSQTSGKELPTFGVDELKGDVEGYRNFFEVLKSVSFVPIKFDRIEGSAKGFYSLTTKDITIKEGMSQLQNVKTAVHEMAHAQLHVAPPRRAGGSSEPTFAVRQNVLNGELDKHGKPKNKDAVVKDKQTEEVEAESIAYVVCQHYGIDTSDYGFSYLAAWSRNRELPELKASLKTIRDTAAEFISQIDEKLKERERTQNKKLENKQDIDIKDDALVPVYQQSAQYAYKNGEREEWRRSNRINNECAEYIRSHVDEAYNNHDLGRFVSELTDKFGLERSMHVIARNIQAKGGDRRFNGEVRERTDQFQFPDMKLDYDNTNSYLVNTHSVVLNFMFRDMMDIEKKLNRVPDKTTPEQMHEYGYTMDIMLPMDVKAAKEYFDKGLPIYALHEDNTESMITSREEIDEHGGLFGIETDEWKAYLDSEHHAPDIAKQPENKEASFIFGQDSAFAIYQLRDDAPRELFFEGIKSIDGVDNVIKENYQMVYSDGIELDGTENTYDILDSIYTEFNQFHPEDFKGHSLSVSDIVVLRQDGELSPYFVDSFGFEEIPHFYGYNPRDLVWDNDKQTYLAKATERMEGRNNEQMLPETNPMADDPAGRMEDMVISGNATLYSTQLERAKQTAQSKRTKQPAQRTSLRKRINDNKAKISGKAVQDKPKTKHKGLEV